MPNNTKHRYFQVSGPDNAPSAREITRDETIRVLTANGCSRNYALGRIRHIQNNPGQPIIAGDSMLYTGRKD